MKKIFTLVAVAITIASCGNKAAQERLTTSNDSLQQVVMAKDSIINDAFMSIDEIATTLDEIAKREKLVTAQASGEINPTTKARINDNIAAISELLEKNKKSLAVLQSTSRKLKDANVQIAALQKLVASLQSQIESKNGEISELSAKLANLNIEVAQLTKSVEGLQKDKAELSQDVADKTVELNTVYYIVGNEKDLLKSEIIDKEGFIGRTAVVGKNANMDSFTKADLRNTERIAVGGKKAKIVTNHPQDSYSLVMGSKNVVEEIVILDPKAFWSNSKILIVSHK